MKVIGEVKDWDAIYKFLEKHNLGDFESAVIINSNDKDVQVQLDFGDGEIGTVVIRRRNGYNGNYRLVSSTH